MHTGTDMAIHMKGIIMDSKFIRLVQSLDPLFPIGSYTLSNGMETYVQKNVVCSREQLKEHLESYLYMLTFNDLAFAAKAYAGCSNFSEYELMHDLNWGVFRMAVYLGLPDEIVKSIGTAEAFLNKLDGTLLYNNVAFEEKEKDSREKSI